MAIPVFQSILLPMLKFCANGNEVYRGDIIEAMAEEFDVSDAERAIMLDKVNQSMFVSRVGWARSYLKAALLIEMTRRGYFRITERGTKLLQEAPTKIDIALLDRYPEFVEFRKGKPKDDGEREAPPTPSDEPTPNDVTPEEALEKAHRDLRSALESELLRQVMDCTPAFFERMVVELLVAMGYGGTLRDAGKAIGKSGDGGVDGIIKEDHLGLDVIYIQAKRWKGTVGRPDVHCFAGALKGKQAHRGVMITTSTFTKDAQEYVNGIDIRIALIDGKMLTSLMIDHNLGVSPVASYEIKKIDSDFFNED
jgi:restriction system protein